MILKRAYNTIFLKKFHFSRSLRLVAQDTALSRREQGFETPRERQVLQVVACLLPLRLLGRRLRRERLIVLCQSPL